jgi:phosphate-selective porin OprO and OprP
MEELRSRLDLQQKQIEQQQKQIQTLMQTGHKAEADPSSFTIPASLPDAAAEETGDIDKKVKQAVEDALKKKDEEAKKKEEEAKKKEEEAKKKKEQEEAAKQAEGVVVGKDLKLSAAWEASGLNLRSADESFRIHIGGRLMSDYVFFSESPGLRQSPTQTGNMANFTGVGPGIGDLADAFFVRRARVVADGQIFQTIEYKTEFDFENYNSISFDESYVGARDLPLIDTIRIGQTHVPFGLEAYTSSRFLPQMERSPLFDAFYQEFAPGIFTDTTFLDQRVTMQHMFHKIDNFSQFNGASFGDGKYAYSGRVSCLPVYEDNGRCLVHLAIDYQWRKGSVPSDFNGGTTLASTPSPAVTTNTDLVRFRTRQSLRDATGLQGDPTRVVDTGNIIADNVQSINPELLVYWGPLWVQSEACLAHVDNAFYPASKAATARGDLNFYGTYVQVGYFLTGENRGYDKRFGKYDRVRPLEPFFLVPREGGGCCHGLGAWELTYRYGIVDLDSDNVQGGRYGEHTVGLNWYWNDNIKLQFNYINGTRNVPDGANSGTVQGLGFRTALEF